MDATIRRRDRLNPDLAAEPSGKVTTSRPQFSPGDSGSYADDRRARQRRGRLVRFMIFVPVWVLSIVPLAREIIDGGGGVNVVLVYLAVGATSLGVAAVVRSVYVWLTKRRFWSPWVFPIAALFAIAGYSVQTAGEEAVPVAAISAESSAAGV